MKNFADIIIKRVAGSCFRGLTPALPMISVKQPLQQGID